MKTRLFVVTLFVAIVGFSACKKDKSTACDMLSVKVGTVTYQATASPLGFTNIYPKACPGSTDTAPSGSVKADITISPKATCSPDKDKSYNFESGQDFVITAEDGKTKKTYTIKFTKDTTSPCN